MTKIHFDTVEEMIRFTDDMLNDDDILLLHYDGIKNRVSRLKNTFAGYSFDNVTLTARGISGDLDVLKDKYKCFDCYIEGKS